MFLSLETSRVLLCQFFVLNLFYIRLNRLTFGSYILNFNGNPLERNTMGSHGNGHFRSKDVRSYTDYKAWYLFII